MVTTINSREEKKRLAVIFIIFSIFNLMLIDGFILF